MNKHIITVLLVCSTHASAATPAEGFRYNSFFLLVIAIYENIVNEYKKEEFL